MQRDAEPSSEKLLASSMRVRFYPHGVVDLICKLTGSDGLERKNCRAIPILRLSAILTSWWRRFFEHVTPCHYRRGPPLNGSAQQRAATREDNDTFHPSVHDRCCSSAVEREPPRAHTANLHSPLHDGASVKLLTRHAHSDRTSHHPFLDRMQLSASLPTQT